MTHPVTQATADAGRLATLTHLELLARLTDADLDLFRLSLGKAVHMRAGQQAIAQGELLDKPAFVFAGWMCRCMTLADGRRQILDFYLPGELIGFSSCRNARAKAAYVCLTDVVLSSAKELVDGIRQNPGRHTGLATALSAIESEIEQGLLDQIVRSGRMQAVEQMVDLMADLYIRLHRTGQADGFLMPLTQDVLGDALGLSTVHVNRALQQLRQTHVIKSRGGKIKIQDPAWLAERARALRFGTHAPA